MKQLLIFISLVLSVLNAETLPNTGLQQNSLGYYGAEVTFGGYHIVGEWRLNVFSIFDFNGTVDVGQIDLSTYGVSEDGLKLSINNNDTFESYTIISNGNYACFNSEYIEDLKGDFHIYFTDSSLICKLKTNQKTYGPSSNKITITVNSE